VGGAPQLKSGPASGRWRGTAVRLGTPQGDGGGEDPCGGKSHLDTVRVRDRAAGVEVQEAGPVSNGRGGCCRVSVICSLCVIVINN